ADEVEQATVTFIVANASLADNNETAIFLTNDSVNLVTKNGADGAQAKGHEPINAYIKQFVENGGKLWVCPACANPRGIKPEDLIDGAVLFGALPMIQYAKTATSIF
ncbi:MAG: DsrE family protein, partial [Rhodospirillaceae bacterium]|nr:DsrE family protein [Rhodospirillaceae bacterium]